MRKQFSFIFSLLSSVYNFIEYFKRLFQRIHRLISLLTIGKSVLLFAISSFHLLKFFQRISFSEGVQTKFHFLLKIVNALSISKPNEMVLHVFICVLFLFVRKEQFNKVKSEFHNINRDELHATQHITKVISVATNRKVEKSTVFLKMYRHKSVVENASCMFKILNERAIVERVFVSVVIVNVIICSLKHCTLCGIQNCHVYQIESRSCMQLSLNCASTFRMQVTQFLKPNLLPNDVRCVCAVHSSLYSGLILPFFSSLSFSCISESGNFTAAIYFLV